jgi:hypothetical protein
MKKLIILGLLACPLFAQQAAKPNLQSRAGGGFVASQYVWETRTATAVTSGSQTVTLYVGAVALPDGRTIFPFATTVPIKIDSGASQEIVTPSAVSGCNTANVATSVCLVTATFTLPHSAGALIQSGTFGLQDAIQDAILAGGGTVYVDSYWAARGGTSSMLTAMTQTATIAVADMRTSHMVVTSGVSKTVTNPY